MRYYKRLGNQCATVVRSYRDEQLCETIKLANEARDPPGMMVFAAAVVASRELRRLVAAATIEACAAELATRETQAAAAATN